MAKASGGTRSASASTRVSASAREKKQKKFSYRDIKKDFERVALNHEYEGYRMGDGWYIYIGTNEPGSYKNWKRDVKYELIKNSDVVERGVTYHGESYINTLYNNWSEKYGVSFKSKFKDKVTEGEVWVSGKADNVSDFYTKEYKEKMGYSKKSSGGRKRGRRTRK